MCILLSRAKSAAVPVDQLVLTPEAVVDEEPKPDTERVIDFLNEVDVADNVLQIEDEVPVSRSARKPNTKRASRAKAKTEPVIELEVEVNSSVEKVQTDVALPPVEVVKTGEKMSRT